MHDHVPTLRARHLGRLLQDALTEAGVSASHVAERLGWSPSKISRILSGKRRAAPAHITAILALCGVKAHRWDAYLALAVEPDNQVWWQDHGGALPVRLPARDDIEDAATTIACYANGIVPDLLTVERYRRAVLRSVHTGPDDDVEGRIADTSRRKRILDRPSPPHVVVYLDEYALTRTGAGDDIMREQIHHLLRMAIRPTVQLRIVPADAATGDIKPFTLFRFADFPTVVFLEFPTSVAFLERAASVATYDEVLTTLGRTALDETATRARLADLGRRRDPRMAPAPGAVAQPAHLVPDEPTASR
jgi:transcriptional regulator with XRE-family HTH domain